MATMDEIVKDLYDIGDSVQYTFDYGQHISSNNYNLNTDGGWTTTTTTITTTDNTGGYVTYPYNSPYSGSTITIPNSGWSTNVTYPVVLQPGEEAWPSVKDALGVVFINGDLIKLKTKNGKEVIIGKLSDNDKTEIIPLEAIAAKKKLLEGSNEEGNV